MKTVWKIPSVILIALMMSCGGAIFTGDGKSGKSGDDHSSTDDSNPTDAKCPKRPQEILVLDFKSGWWAGDGGNFFNSLLTALTSKCVIHFEYHHIIYNQTIFGGVDNIVKRFPDKGKEEKLPANLEKGFHQTDWNKYTQIWFLSGSSSDLADVLLDEKFFVQILDQIATKKRPNLFIGAGYGSISHSNALLEKIENATRFATDLPEGRILNPEGGIEVVTKIVENKDFDIKSPIFDNIREVADHVKVDGELASGDYITSHPSDVLIVGKNTEGKPSFATTTHVERRIFMDAGLQRYYAVLPPVHEGTYELLRNIIRHLAD